MSETPYDPTEGANPCPFCGRPAEIYRTGSPAQPWGVWHWHQEAPCPIQFYGFYRQKYQSREEALQGWNSILTLQIPSCVFAIENKQKKAGQALKDLPSS